MGLSLSLFFSAWEEIVEHMVFSLAHNISSPENEEFGFKKSETEKISKSDISDAIVASKGKGLKNSKPVKIILERVVSFKDTLQFVNTLDKKVHKLQVNPIFIPKPIVFLSPRPSSELDAAAIKLQKVYKSYRTRRNLADCAVVVEELWWKALDFASLKRSSISFFDVEKLETTVSRWARARTRAAKVGKGLSKDEKAQKLALQHWLEAIDPRHRYGHNLRLYYDVWFDSESSQPFFFWLDVGDGKEVNLETCSRNLLQYQCINYLGPKERDAYEVVIENGKLKYSQSGALVETMEKSKWIFVLSTVRALYVGQKKKGIFQHSSFLAGGAITAAGRLVAHNGVLEAIWPYSGHYHPTEENFREFINFLEDHHVNLTDVKRYAVDDDSPSLMIVEKQSKQEKTEATTTMDSDQENDKKEGNEKIPDRLSYKWSTGTRPRIGCVRDYPLELQCRALEQVNLSPGTTHVSFENYGPIPFARPSPKVRLSPRLSCMSLPSTRANYNSMQQP